MEKKGRNDMSNVKVDLMKDGPILVNGKIELKNSKGNLIKTDETVALCRCGGSKNKPFCDGAHSLIGFKE